MKNIDTIIVNYRTASLTIEAARSVLKEPATNRVIIVDNASGDDSLRVLDKTFADQPVDIVASPTNVGFGGGNNLGAEHSKAEYLFFLNSDAFVLPGCLELLRITLEKNPKLGLVAPKILLSDRKTTQADAVGIFPTPFAILFQHSKKSFSGKPEWISGVAFMARREEFLKLGGFSRELFLYFEDVELCYRYRKSNYNIDQALSAAVVHLGGQSQQSTHLQKDRYYQSQDMYLRLTGASWLGRWLVKLLRHPYRLLMGW